MKIIIEGEPKEIAALELALKDGMLDCNKYIKFSVPDGMQFHIDGGSSGTNGVGPATILLFKHREVGVHHHGYI